MFDLYVGGDRRRESFVVDCAFYDDLREKFKNVLMKEGIEFGKKGDRGWQEAAAATTSRYRTTRSEQGGGSQAAPRNFELLPRRYALAASRCFAAGPKNLKRDFLAFVVVNL